MIAVVDYGSGNLFSLVASLKSLGLAAKVTDKEEDIRSAQKIILPGVGAFADAKAKLAATELIPLLLSEIGKGKPLLGICLGMQLLLEKSLEYGEHSGLGLVPGTAAPLAPLEGLKVPHMGWNSLHIVKDDPLFKYTTEGEYVYFVHSFYGKGCGDSTLALSCYGGVSVTAAVRSGSACGTQFHPEKSGAAGLKILKAFSEIE